MGILPGLFTFTPVRGTALALNPQPKLEAYRRVQLARYLIVNAQTRFDDMSFTQKGEIKDFGNAKNVLAEAVKSGKPFQTAGCKDCNRPFYNEKPSGPIYNYPRSLTTEETAQIETQLSKFLN
jgi:biotin synthase